MPNPAPRVFTVPSSVPFLPTVIRALADGSLIEGFAAGRDPLALAGVTLYLPTRRACRLAREVFLATLGRDAAILPRVVAIGDVDADEIGFAEAAAVEPAGATLELPEALGGLERKMALAELILQWATSRDMHGAAGARLIASSPAAALGLAGDLARLMDDMTTRQVPWDRLDKLVPDDVDKYWQMTLEFLQIARQQWPALLAERGKIEPTERRDRLIAAECTRLRQLGGPVIAAGSTGSMPATAMLLETIAKLPHGAVVLPGLDQNLDDDAWDLIGSDDAATGFSHPQYAMHALLRRIGIPRDAVQELAPPARHGRERLVSEAMRPAESTEAWQQRLNDTAFTAKVDAALRGLSVIEAANAEEESLAIAIALREAVETAGKTAALVTPDRALARRVIAALSRWQVPVDDSGGDSLADTPAGVFARLVAEAALGGLAPVTLLAMLKHPLCRAEPRGVWTLERVLLRGPRPKSGTAGLAHALKSFREARKDLHRNDPRAAIPDADLAAADKPITAFVAALGPLEAFKNAIPFAAIAARHRDALRQLGRDCEDLDEVFDDIAATGRLVVLPREYPEMFRVAIADRVVRRPEANVQVRIFGLLEARLQSVDRVVLGGLNEGVWPPETRSDPWLSRPMRRTLGLDLPERRIGLTGHDFAQALGASEVVLSRAAKVGGAPTVASRFVQRLAAVAGEARWQAAVDRGTAILAMARRLDRPDGRPRYIERPEPRPPRDARPTSLSVTEIETWLRDPYSIYARHILGLRPLDPIDAPPGARDRGTLIHNAIGKFSETFKAGLPADALARLIELGEFYFLPLQDFPDARAFWWPRFNRIARWFIDFDLDRRARLKKLDVEIPATLDIAIGERLFTLRGRADRIEHLADGRYAILDYKTGRVSSPKEVRSGLAPQLTLEGAMLRAGRFGDVPRGASIAEFAYVVLRGGEPPGERKDVAWKDTTPDAEADTALRRLTGVVAEFDKQETPYRSRERPQFMRRGGGDYDHLARVKEWSLSGGVGDEEASPE